MASPVTRVSGYNLNQSFLNIQLVLLFFLRNSRLHPLQEVLYSPVGR